MNEKHRQPLIGDLSMRGVALYTLACRHLPVFIDKKWCLLVGNATVKPVAELHNDGLQVSVAGVVDEVPEAVQVVVDGFPALVVGRGLEDVDSFGFLIERGEVLTELVFEVRPLAKTKLALFRFQFELTGRPSTCATSFHVGHCPDDLLDFIVEGFWAEADIGAA